MHGSERDQKQLLTVMIVEERIPVDHPIRKLKKVTDQVLASLLPGLQSLYSQQGRKGVPPEFLLRALVLQAVFSVRSERQLCEQLNWNLMFRWFVGLDLDEPAWDATTFTKNRQRLIDSEAGQAFLSRTTELAEKMGLLTDDRFVTDGTLIKAYASMKSFKKDESDSDNFKGTKRTNQTHKSTTDQDARLMRKGAGHESMLCHLAALVVHSASGIVQAARVAIVGERSEVDLALAMAEELPKGSVLSADKGYDCGKFREGCQRLGVTGHPAPRGKGSSVDGRTTRHESFKQSMKERPRVEKAFGWAKGEGRMRQTRFRGSPKVALAFELTLSALNLVRLAKHA